MENKCYRADYDVIKDGKNVDQRDEYFWCETDEEAVNIAKEDGSRGINYADIGHCELSLVQVVEVDDSQECFPEIRTIWW